MTQIVEPGDSITVVVKGTVPHTTSKATEVVIKPERPGPAGNLPGSVLADWKGFGDALEVHSIANAKVEVIFTSRFKNGVHIDLSDGLYWIRRPDGWQPMYVGDSTIPGSFHGKTAPKQPQRLREDREYSADDEDQFDEWN